jgi:hypothetical protein
MLEGFADKTAETPGATIRAVIGGSAAPLPQPYGLPQTRAMWHKPA